MKSFYAIVTFGNPASDFRRVTNSRGEAINNARKAKGSGSCTVARVYQCPNLKMAQTADLGRLRRSEYCIFDA